MPTTKLTALGVEKIKAPKSGREEHFDRTLPGFGLRVTDKGAKSWIVLYRVKEGPDKGRARRFTLGRFPVLGLGAAREAAGEALRQVDAGGDPAKEKRARREAPAPKIDTFDSVSADFIERHAKRKTRSWGETKRIFDKYVSPSWGSRAVGEITRRDTIELLETVHDRNGPIMANRVLAALRKLYNWAGSRDVVDGSPIDGVEPPGKEIKRDRALSDLEIATLWKASDRIDHPFGPLFKLLLATAQRRNEVAQMQWLEIDFEARTWTVPAERSKNGKPNVVPLSDLAVEMLEGIPRVGKAKHVLSSGRRGDRPVSGFTSAKSQIDRRMAEVLAEEAREAGEDAPAVEPWTIHDIRRTVATGVARLGVPLHVLQKLLNHVPKEISGVEAVYNVHPYTEEKRQAVEAWGRHLSALLGRGRGNVVPLKTAG